MGADLQPVAHQGLLVTGPQCDGGVVTPSVAGHRQRPQHLNHLHPLLTEATHVEHLGTGVEILGNADSIGSAW